MAASLSSARDGVKGGFSGDTIPLARLEDDNDDTTARRLTDCGLTAARQRHRRSAAGLRIVLDVVGLVALRLRVLAPFEVEQLDFPEVDRRRLRLDRDVASRQRRAIDL